MQLIVDTGAPVDIEFKMTTIKEVSLKEMITNNVDDMYTDDGKNSGNIVKDVSSDIAESDRLERIQFNDKVAQDDATASTVESDKKTSIEDCESISHSPLSSINESNKPEDVVNNDNLISQHKEPDSQNNSEEKENFSKTDATEKLEKSELNVNVISKSEARDKINCVDIINSKDHEHTINVSKTDKITVKANETINKREQTMNDSKPESLILDSVNDQVSNKADDKKEQCLQEVAESQSENTVSVLSPKIDPDENKAISSENVSDSTLENAAKTKDSMKEREKPEVKVASTEANIESGTIEIEDEKINEKTHNDKKSNKMVENKVVEGKKELTLISKLTNILDLLSDDEVERQEDTSNKETCDVDKQCISLVDDDDVMLIDEDTSFKEDVITISNETDKVIPDSCVESTTPNQQKKDSKIKDGKQESGVVNDLENKVLDNKSSDINENSTPKPLLSSNFLNTCKKSLADMTRQDLEEFCSLKIVESIMDRSNLGDLKTQIKTMAVTLEEFKKKANLISKQNRDLQVVLKSVQEQQKKSSGNAITPLKITRSVGIQVLMTDKCNAKNKNAQKATSRVTPTAQPSLIDKTNHFSGVQKVQKTKNQPIPVPRLVPATNTGNKTNLATASVIADPGKSPQVPLINGMRNSPPIQKPEKRLRTQSVTVDLTDDEPPVKVTAKSSPASGVRLVPAQNLLPPQRPQFSPTMTSPRKVYIPISGPQSQNVRPAAVLKSVPPLPGVRPRMPANNNANKVQPNTILMNRATTAGRHPAPLPDAVKQYQPASWKALPPAPDLKLSKVENGIVISWKIDGYQEDSYEEIISYQLFAYQETNSPPSTALWKKIGDVKALPLPMACTLTQFLAGYKYYFAVRAIDIKSRFGPFSLPASILLLNKI